IVDKPRDRDHVIRRAFLTVQIGGESHPSWELALFRKAFPFSKAEEFPPAVRDVAINYRLRFNEFPHIPFWRLLEGNVLDKEIRNKIILFGLTAEVFHDIHTTPLGSMPGLAVNANVLLMLIKDSFFSSVPAWVVMALTFLSFWLILLMALSGSFVIALLTVSFLILLYLATSFLLFSNQILLDLWLLAVGMILALISAFLFQGVQLFFENLKLREEAVRDPLTGFYNRRFLVLKLKSEFKRMALKRGWPKNGLEISVVMMDLDNFKLVNDSFGHAEGDRVLSVMAQAICSSVRKNELICRYGGDEFCVILIGISIQDAVKFAEKIRGIIAGNSDLVYRTADRVATIRVTASIGVASVAGIKAIEPEKLLKAADRALYRAKSGGRNQVCVFDPARDVIT
ncbi:MAG: diguanylate cyclase, partial [Candidatus Omnitrophica bacterium]|nr:diguanylate cyclase [Candidatus Omnitrophota bacterium]